MSERTEPLKLGQPLRRQKALEASWKPILLNWLVPGAGYWVIGEKARAKVLFGVSVVFAFMAWLQLSTGAGEGIRGGVYVPVLGPIEWLPTLGALATAGVGPVYGVFAWAFGVSHGSVVVEPVRTLTQEYGATYIMVAGLLNWLACFDLFDRLTGRWVYRLPKDEQEELARAAQPAKAEEPEEPEQ
jgi:hypothetical protein